MFVSSTPKAINKEIVIIYKLNLIDSSENIWETTNKYLVLGCG